MDVFQRINSGFGGSGERKIEMKARKMAAEAEATTAQRWALGISLEIIDGA